MMVRSYRHPGDEQARQEAVFPPYLVPKYPITSTHTRIRPFMENLPLAPVGHLVLLLVLDRGGLARIHQRTGPVCGLHGGPGWRHLGRVSLLAHGG